MYNLVQSINSAKFRKDPFEEYYEQYEEIGKGIATVYRVIEKSTRTEYAAKFIMKKRMESSRRGVAKENIEKEIYILAEMEHANIIYLHQVYENRQQVILVLELVRGGELFDFISEREWLSEEEASGFIKQILLGVKHMHDKDVAHLDLKPENVMLKNSNSRQLKLIDFGLSKKLKPGEEIREMLGTTEFVSPEVINYEPLSLNTDMWSLGVIAYIMLSGASPFLGDTQQETYANVIACDYEFDEELFSETSELAKDFIRKLFVKEQTKRASVDECLEHPWIQPMCAYDKNNRRQSNINIDSFKKFHIRRRWKHSMKVTVLCNELTRLRRAKLRGGGSANLKVTGSGEIGLQNGNLGILASEVIGRNSLGVSNMATGRESVQTDNFVLSAIFCAIKENNREGLDKLLSMANMDVNQTNQHGEAAIHVSAGLGQLEILKIIVSKGGNLGIVDNRGNSVLYWAAREGHVNVVQFLVSKGVLVTMQNKSGESCLHAACNYGHTSTVQYLTSINLNLDLQDIHQNTCLHVAAWHGFTKIILFLWQSKANIHLKNKDGDTALHIASRRGHLECIRVLESMVFG